MQLLESDVRSIIRLLGEAAERAGSGERVSLVELKRFLVEGLCQLVDADSWVWTLACRIEPGQPQTYAGLQHGGFSDEQFARFVEAVEHPDMIPVTAPFFSKVLESPSQTTMIRHEIDPEGLSEQGEVGRLWEAAGVGSLIMSSHSFEDGSQSGIGIYRKVGRERFAQREKLMVHFVLEEVGWLHRMGWPEDRGATVPSLYPRERMVLNLLLDGMTRKEIAHHLDISENTVAGYAKKVYQHFGVRSQIDLLRKFLVAAS